ncbi:AP2-like ethylene-responsive transcription factor AIL6 [Salvia splendens]|uniref:AP2-like ethylene-responsive transcription factor AIL6 n=1 Tax=Salvia splendens TaxID=180675 RepID=UPI001C258906|nr:AP2-like ethylene-responsive transcription factor AIL6 [Salvia splendens]
MAPDNNWLSFSLSSMEMLNSSSSSSSHQPNHSHHYYSFGDNFYTSGWPSHKSADDDIHYMQHQQQAPKLEDFFAAGGDSTETQDSSLTHIYDHHHGAAAYFDGAEQQDLKSIIGFQSFSANSASNVDDSPFAAKTQSPGESATELAPYSHSPAAAANGLSLDVSIDNNSNTDKAVVAADSKKIADTFGQRTSIYRGVTRHRWTGRYEAHLWDNSCRREGQARKGRQVYLGGYDKEDKAARSYDLAALKYWGPTATTNFPMSNYAKEVEEMKHMTKQEFIASLRRKSSGFSRGASIYRGVTRHHQQGRWQARIGRVAGNKDLYLGTFATEEEAAEAYDIAAIKFRGINAVTNFEMNRYDVEAIAKCPLPIGGTAKRLKHSLEGVDKALPLGSSSMLQTPCNSSGGSSISFAAIQPSSGIPCGVPLDHSTPYYHHNLFHHLYPNDPVASDTSSSVSSLTTPMGMMQAPGEYFVWPHHTY